MAYGILVQSALLGQDDVLKAIDYSVPAISSADPRLSELDVDIHNTAGSIGSSRIPAPGQIHPLFTGDVNARHPACAAFEKVNFQNYSTVTLRFYRAATISSSARRLFHHSARILPLAEKILHRSSASDRMRYAHMLQLYSCRGRAPISFFAACPRYFPAFSVSDIIVTCHPNALSLFWRAV